MTEAQRLTQEAHLDTIHRLMIAAEHRDHDTAGHIERIGLYSGVVARTLGLAPGHAELIRHAAPMHDVGKLGVPDHVLLKRGKLDEDEWKIMRAHTTMGANILSGSAAPVLQLGEKIALSHHEKWDGSGYPHGLEGEAIPTEGRICSVVDFFDALTMDRPYRKAVANAEVIATMRTLAGTHFDPRVLEAFLGSLTDIVAIQATYRAAPPTP
jgi:putative two-component system response regulator